MAKQHSGAKKYCKWHFDFNRGVRAANYRFNFLKFIVQNQVKFKSMKLSNICKKKFPANKKWFYISASRIFDKDFSLELSSIYFS